MTTPRNSVPDLLKRFVPTPYKMIAKGRVIETNDPGLIEQFDQPAGLDVLDGIAPDFHIRVVRDAGTPGRGDEVRVLCAQPVYVVLVGTGTIIMIDRGQRCIFSFLDSDISDKQFVHVYLPMALAHTDAHRACQADVAHR